MKKVSFKIFCPKGVRTGGPEALHQLADALLRLGRDAEIVYFGHLDAEDSFPEYDVPKVFEYRNEDNNLVVVPEVSTHLLRKVDYWKSAIYWLSVDNFLKGRVRLLDAHTPSRFRKYIASKVGFLGGGYRFKKGFLVDYHLYQSEYAKLFLLNNLRKADGKIFEVTDYLPKIYQDCVSKPNTVQEKRDWVAYNPKKLGEVGQAVLNLLPKDCLKPVQSLDQKGVINLLEKCKVYIDFGHHPGMDRIPREAAACGCLLLVGERGSASYFKDVPLPAEYKIDLRKVDLNAMASKIGEMLIDYEELLDSTTLMRENVSLGRDRFDLQVKQWINEVDL